MPSVTERTLKDGSRVYEIRVARGRDPVTGKQLTPYTTRYKPPEGWSAKKAMKQAQVEAAAFEARCRAGEVMTKAERKTYEQEQIRIAEQAKREEASKLTFSGYVELFLKESAISRSDGTLSNYRNVFRRAAPILGEYKMEEITPVIMRSYITELQANGVSERNGAPLSYNTVAKHYNVLHTFFEAAVTDEIIEFSPMQRMKKPKPKKDEIKMESKALTVDQSKRLIECLKNEPLMWRALVMLLLDSGCRRGEAVALRWDDVDLKTGYTHVKGNAQYTVEKGKYITTPKSGKGRMVILNQPVIAILKEWKREQAKWLLSMGLPHTGFIFTQDDGEMLNPNAPTKYLSKFGKKYNFPGLHPHTLRHTMATVSIANGADIVSISKKLGHAAPSITLNIYSHANQEAQLRANKSLEMALYKNA